MSRQLKIRMVGALAGLVGVAMLLTSTVGASATVLHKQSAPKTHSAPKASASNHVILQLIGNVGGPQPRTFNPYLPTSGINALWGAAGMIYEPLVQQDNVRPSINYPWLAQSWTWSNSDKTLTFHLHKGVKWSNGTPFTSADVVFTYEMIKKNPELNAGNISFLTVAAKGPLTVVMTFAKPAYTQFYFIAEDTFMVPKSIWEHVKNPATYEDSNPVGTGPFLLSTFNATGMLLVRNPNYWQAGLPKIYGLHYLVYSSGTTAVEAMDSGVIDWGFGPIPDGQKLFIDKAPKYNNFWYPAAGLVSLLPNESVWPLNMAAVRQAISLAVGRKEISSVGESGYEPSVTSATGVLIPNFTSQIDSAYKGDNLNQVPEVSKARAVLKAAGFKVGSKGLFEMGGRTIQLSISDPSGYTDYMTDDQIMASELKAAGIGITVVGQSEQTWLSDLADGHFQLSTDYSAEGTLFQILQSVLDYSLSGPIGTSASGGNYERWNTPQTQQFINEYMNATTNSVRQSALSGLEGIMVKSEPVIPLVGESDWGSWSTRQVTGFASPSNPYEGPSMGTPGGEVVALHLVPRGK